jgi:hypothetical protein
MKPRICAAVALVCLSSLSVVGLAQTSTKGSTNNLKSKHAPTTQGSPANGEKRFQINCGRCHNAPEDISPREARAVARHMRVRATLSAEDEKLILEFFAP